MDSISRSILIGSILGDGHLDKSTRNGSRWIVKYDDGRLDYLGWLRDQTRSLIPSELKRKKGYHQHYFSTKPSLEIAGYRHIFYPKGKKVVPRNIRFLLRDPLSLAVWYMDDGCLDKRDKYHFNANLATYCFSYEECERLAKTLKANFKVKARVHKCTMRGKLRYRLYIMAASMPLFVTIVRPYIQPSLLYKIAS